MDIINSVWVPPPDTFHQIRKGHQFKFSLGTTSRHIPSNQERTSIQIQSGYHLQTHSIKSGKDINSNSVWVPPPDTFHQIRKGHQFKFSLGTTSRHIPSNQERTSIQIQSGVPPPDTFHQIRKGHQFKFSLGTTSRHIPSNQERTSIQIQSGYHLQTHSIKSGKDINSNSVWVPPPDTFHQIRKGHQFKFSLGTTSKHIPSNQERTSIQIQSGYHLQTHSIKSGKDINSNSVWVPPPDTFHQIRKGHQFKFSLGTTSRHIPSNQERTSIQIQSGYHLQTHSIKSGKDINSNSVWVPPPDTFHQIRKGHQFKFSLGTTSRHIPSNQERTSIQIQSGVPPPDTFHQIRKGHQFKFSLGTTSRHIPSNQERTSIQIQSGYHLQTHSIKSGKDINSNSVWVPPPDTFHQIRKGHQFKFSLGTTSRHIPSNQERTSIQIQSGYHLQTHSIKSGKDINSNSVWVPPPDTFHQIRKGHQFKFSLGTTSRHIPSNQERTSIQIQSGYHLQTHSIKSGKDINSNSVWGTTSRHIPSNQERTSIQIQSGYHLQTHSIKSGKDINSNSVWGTTSTRILSNQERTSIERCQKTSGTFIKIIETFCQSLRNAFAAACFAFADLLHATTSIANPFVEFLLLTSKKSISKGESFLICNHCFRNIFANLSPTFRLIIRNLWGFRTTI